ncbi:glycosyl hydrolase family 16 [Christiangramia gaetbulicola]|uniref:Glycosyl hydrolase family 16 n=1 Tax=Christiangramia gaetbulicola TaxID=703340 RepID=A0A2T6AGF1_9FLAO|nr:glycoside hydrolase family 16 protein [Christiangramia gaetbulicola]PTX42885.1 glycosyl hydrolase family 16 [Christiangramia gaetbulicola]
MKAIFILIPLFISTFSFQARSQNYKLIWSDDFQYSGKPDPEKWNYETGFIRNLEEQIYTKRKKNVRVHNGKLEIIALKEDYENKKYDASIKNYRYNTPYAEFTSGSINTKGKFDFLYGRVEVRAKLPAGKGVWPAIWMLGANFDEVDYPNAGEIDIMEHVGIEPEEIHGTVHFPGEDTLQIISDGGIKILENASEQFHIYSVDWTYDKIEFLIDNKVYHTFRIEEAGLENNPFRKPFYLILNLALGGKWAGKIDPDILPQKFLVDYVRVYQRKEN